MKILALVGLALITENLVFCSNGRRRARARNFEDPISGNIEGSSSALTENHTNIRRRSNLTGLTFRFHDPTRTRSFQSNPDNNQINGNTYNDGHDEASEQFLSSSSLAAALSDTLGNVASTEAATTTTTATINLPTQENTQNIGQDQTSAADSAVINQIPWTISNSQDSADFIPFTQPDPPSWYTPEAVSQSELRPRAVSLGLVRSSPILNDIETASSEDEANESLSENNQLISGRPIDSFPRITGRSSTPYNPNQIIHLPRRGVSVIGNEDHQPQNDSPLVRTYAIGPGSGYRNHHSGDRAYLNAPVELPRRHSRAPLNFNNIFSQLNRVQSTPFYFDISDDWLLPYVSELSLIEPVQDLPAFYGHYIDPTSGERHIVPLPLNYSQIQQEVESSDSSESSEDESTVANNEASSTSGSSSTTDSSDSDNEDDQNDFDQPTLNFHTPGAGNTPLSTPSRRQNNYQTPERGLRPTPTCPGAPLPFQHSEEEQTFKDALEFGNNDDDSIGCSRNYGNKICGSVLRSLGQLSSCAKAESKFERAMARNHSIPQVHFEFPLQEQLIDIIHKYSESSVLLEPEHLRAFEVDFNTFFKLVQRCPSKYLLPSLALSLQYDADFPKFLELFFKLKHNFDHDEDFFHDWFLELILNMPIVSNSAYQFFSNSRNASFVFSNFNAFPCFYGKFSPNYIALILSRYQARDLDYSRNPLRAWLLNFNYSALIDQFCMDSKFASANLEILPRVRNLFANDRAYSVAYYKLFKCSFDGSRHYLVQLQMADQIRAVLHIALEERDLEIIKCLYFNFRIEQDDGPEISFRSDQNRHVEVTVIDEIAYLIKIIDGYAFFTITLPL